MIHHETKKKFTLVISYVIRDPDIATELDLSTRRLEHATA